MEKTLTGENYTDKKTFPMELVRSGHRTDGLGYTANFIRQAFENTVECVENYSHFMPVHSSHEDYSYRVPEANEGFITNITLVDHPLLKGEVLLRGDVTLTGELLMDYEAKKYPKQSIEFRPQYVAPNGKMIGWLVEGLSLNGNHAVAFPDLKQNSIQNHGVLSKLLNSVQSVLGTLGTLVNKKKKGAYVPEKIIEDKDKDTDKDKEKDKDTDKDKEKAKDTDYEDYLARAQAGLTMAAEGLAMIGEALEMSADEVESLAGAAATIKTNQRKPALVTSATDSKMLNTASARITALEKQLTDQAAAGVKHERDIAFDILHKNGKIATQEREVFDALATVKGLALAVATYEPRSSNTPVRGGAYNVGIPPVESDTDSIRKMYESNGLSQSEIEKRISVARARPMNLRMVDFTEAN